MIAKNPPGHDELPKQSACKPSAYAPVHATTEVFPVEKRLAMWRQVYEGMWREIYGTAITRFEVDPLNDAPFHAEVTLRGLPGLGIAFGARSDAHYRMTRALAAQASDSLLLSIVTQGIGTVSQFGREVTVGAGGAVLIAGPDPSVCTLRQNGRFLTLALPREAVAPLIADLDAVLARPISNSAPGLKLLLGYVSVLQDASALSTPEMARTVAAHITDLAIMVVGGTPEAAEAAAGRGIRAARLHAIKSDVAKSLTDRELSVDAIAARHGISSRYLRMLFEAEGLTFSEFVLERRLARAYRLLSDQRYAKHSISSIAFEVGFGDLSYFNRVFRRRYGGTPTEIRDTSQRRD
jgi:AraC-like DNA-binding protein